MKKAAAWSRVKRSQAVLRDLRFRANVTQVELARRLGKPQSYISKYENGERRLDFAEIVDICDALEVTLSSFTRKAEPEVRRPHKG